MPGSGSSLDTQIQHKAFLLLLALVTVAFFWLLLPFFGAVFWAVILAIVFQPLQRAFERRLGVRQQPRGGLSVLVCIVIAIIPVTSSWRRWSTRAPSCVQRVQSGEIDPTAALAERAVGAARPGRGTGSSGSASVTSTRLRDRLLEALQRAGQFLAARALNVGQNTLRFVASVGIMLYVLFFLFRDGRTIARNIRAAMPFSEDYNRRAARQVHRGGAGDRQGQHRHRHHPGDDRRRGVLAARHQGRAALGRR